MTSRRPLTALLMSAPLVQWACTGGPAPSAVPAHPIGQGARAPAGRGPEAPPTPLPPAPASAGPPLLEPTTSRPPAYTARGRRDPFERVDAPRPPEAPAPPSILAAARLSGIVRGAAGTLALVETPEGIAYILRSGQTLEDGRLLEIRRDSVVFEILSKPARLPEHVVLRLEPTP